MPNSKTTTDLAFESYLNQRKIAFQFESLSNRITMPDYLITKSSKRILVECEEINNLPADHLLRGVGTIDLGQTLEVIREKIEVAGKQLKPYKDDIDHMVILIGKKQGFEIDLSELFWAMFGDPVIRVPLSEDPTQRKPAYSDMKVKGAMRKNQPDTKRMYFPYNYVGAVGIIKGFNGLSYHKNKLFDKYHPTVEEDLDVLLSQTLDFMENGWLNYQDEVPDYLLEKPDTILYKIELVINPLSPKPLPTDIFNGKWDITQKPTVSESLNFR